MFFLGGFMKKLEQLNKLLNQGFSVDIFNYNDSNTNELHKKMLEKLDKYFKYTLSFEDLIKLTYGEDAEIVRVYNFNKEKGIGDIYRISGKDFLYQISLQPIAYKAKLKDLDN